MMAGKKEKGAAGMKTGENIYKLRTEANLSRERFAELCGVSVQAVQKWESGATVPDLANAVKIAAYFGITVDCLIFGRDLRKAEFVPSEMKPDYGNLPQGETYYGLLDLEYTQSTEEGLDLERYRDLFAAAATLPQGEVKKRIGDALFLAVCNAEIRKDFAYNEPSDYETIKTLCTGGFEKREPDSDSIESKIHGAWMGRICGCLLGKTVEGMRTDELVPLLKETDNYPMRRYITRAEMSEEIYAKYKYGLRVRAYADDGEGMPADDDTNYLVLGQMIIEKFGREFTPYDVLSTWAVSQPKSAYWTAEQIAYCNFVKGYCPPETAKFQNPYREWIGAQIRGDYYGYINAGDPEAAAEAAFRDASISHVKNGIYGEMFVSAMIAEAAVEQDIETIVLAGLSQIPATSRLHAALSGVLDGWRKGVSCKDAFAGVHRRFDEFSAHGWCHVIANAMIVCAALLYGRGDYGKSICLAVETGYDTDCNGATVGSVLGMRNGIGGIGAEWTKPVGDTLYTEILGRNKVSVKECVQKTLEHLRKK